MATSFKDNMDGKSWEKFCEVMIRQHYGVENFFNVPAKDHGDHGIEFYTVCGHMFQCYYPEKVQTMAQHKSDLKRKINEDLAKLTKYKDGIADMLNDITINRWFLLVPYFESKDLLKYCVKKTNEIRESGLPFVDRHNFMVKIETDESFLEASLYARNVSLTNIDINVCRTEDINHEDWMRNHSSFNKNLNRKTEAIAIDDVSKIRKRMIEYYVQVEELLEAYRDQHPNIHAQLSALANNNLTVLFDNSMFERRPANDIFKELMSKNREVFGKMPISEMNNQILTMGYISRWLAECKMEFIL